MRRAKFRSARGGTCGRHAVDRRRSRTHRRAACRRRRRSRSRSSPTSRRSQLLQPWAGTTAVIDGRVHLDLAARGHDARRAGVRNGRQGPNLTVDAAQYGLHFRNGRINAHVSRTAASRSTSSHSPPATGASAPPERSPRPRTRSTDSGSERHVACGEVPRLQPARFQSRRVGQRRPRARQGQGVARRARSRPTRAASSTSSIPTRRSATTSSSKDGHRARPTCCARRDVPLVVDVESRFRRPAHVRRPRPRHQPARPGARAQRARRIHRQRTALHGERHLFRVRPEARRSIRAASSSTVRSTIRGSTSSRCAGTCPSRRASP